MDIQKEAAVSAGSFIVSQAKHVNLNPSLLYEAVIDLSSEGLLTANCINRAAGILLNDLGLPPYFFETITKESLKHILSSIAKSINIQGDKVELGAWVADINVDLGQDSQLQRVRIATKETRRTVEKLLDTQLTGHRREYYYNPEKEYYTYIFRPETIDDYSGHKSGGTRFLFGLDQDYDKTPRMTRNRYEKFLETAGKAVIPQVEVFSLSDIGEIRFMFNSDFARPQMHVLRRLFADHGLVITRAYWEPYATKAPVPSSICSLYVQGELSRQAEDALVNDLRSFLSFAVNHATRLYADGQLSFQELLFAGNAIDFTHMFIYKERGNQSDRDIMGSLENADHKAAFASRLHESNKFTYVYRAIEDNGLRPSGPGPVFVQAV